MHRWGEDFIGLLEFLFPPRCIICNEILSQESIICICEACAFHIDYYNNRINSLGLPESHKVYCDGIICVGRYNNSLKNSIKKFKFGNKPSYFRAFGTLLSLKVKNTENLDKIDIVIPVPLHKSRRKQRGYNQAELIAVYTAKQLGVRLESSILIKTMETQTQSLLSKTDRLTNLEEAFSVRFPKQVAGKNILLVDDIITTGSTVNQCSKALKAAGAHRVIAGVIATTRAD